MNAVTTVDRPRSVLVDMAHRYGMEPRVFADTLRATVIPPKASNEEFAAFLMVAKQYSLNPITREIYAFPKQGGGIQPIVSVDGWANLINSHPSCDGFDFEDHVDDKANISAITCRMYRKDRSHPITATEYMAECRRDTQTWKQWPRRMLRHKALIQAARYAFGFAGIVDPDEAERFIPAAREAAQRHERGGPPPAPALEHHESASSQEAAVAGPEPIPHAPQANQGSPATNHSETTAQAVQDASGQSSPDAHVRSAAASDLSPKREQQLRAVAAAATPIAVKVAMEQVDIPDTMTGDEFVRVYSSDCAAATTRDELDEAHDLHAEAMTRYPMQVRSLCEEVYDENLARLMRAERKPAEAPRTPEATETATDPEPPPAANVGEKRAYPKTWAEYVARAEQVLTTKSGEEAFAWWDNTKPLRDAVTHELEDLRALKKRFMDKKKGGQG